jgi:hypothetical protein
MISKGSRESLLSMKITPSGKTIGAAIGMFILVALKYASFGADATNLPNHVPPHYWGTPVTGTPLMIPGIIRAADYDISPNGANNITFSYNGDSQKTEFRPGEDSIGLAAFGDDHVSTAGVPEKPGQVYVGWTQPGEWLKYTVQVAETGTYVIGGKFAAGSTGATLTFTFTPELSTGEIEIPTTAGFQPGVEVYHVWENLDHLKEITLPAGIYVMTVKIGKVAGLNLELFSFTKKPSS